MADSDIIAKLIIEGVDAAKDQLRATVKEADKVTESVEKIGKDGKKSVDDLTGSLNQQTLQTKGLAAAQKVYTFAVEGTSIAMKILKFAIAATGIGLLIIALAAVAVNFDKIKAKIISLVPGLANLGEKFKQFKAIVMGVLDGVFEGLKVLGRTILAVIFPTPGNIQKAADAWRGAGENIGRAYKEGLEAELEKIRIEKLLDGLDAQLSSTTFRARLAKALGDGTKAARLVVGAAFIELTKALTTAKLKLSDLGANGENIALLLSDQNISEERRKQIEAVADAYLLVREAGKAQIDLKDKIAKALREAEEKAQALRDKIAKADQAQRDKNAEAYRKELEDLKEFNDKKQKLNEESFEKKQELDRKEGSKENEDIAKRFAKILDSNRENADRLEQQTTLDNKEREEMEQAYANAVLQIRLNTANRILQIAQEVQKFASNLSNAILSISRVNAENEIAVLDDKKKRGVISEKQYNKEIAKIKNELAQKEHAAQVAEAAIKVPIAILEGYIAGLQAGGPAGPIVGAIFAAIAGAFAAVQLAAVAASPVPKYAKGGWIRGKTHSQGGELIEGQKDEYVVQSDATRFYTKKYGQKFFDDINTMRYDPVLNSQNLFGNKDIKSDYKMYEHLATIAGYLKQGYKIDEKGNTYLRDISESIKSSNRYV